MNKENAFTHSEFLFAAGAFVCIFLGILFPDRIGSLGLLAGLVLIVGALAARPQPGADTAPHRIQVVVRNLAGHHWLATVYYNHVSRVWHAPSDPRERVLTPVEAEGINRDTLGCPYFERMSPASIRMLMRTYTFTLPTAVRGVE
jgi:hypothetical protein